MPIPKPAANRPWSAHDKLPRIRKGTAISRQYPQTCGNQARGAALRKDNAGRGPLQVPRKQTRGLGKCVGHRKYSMKKFLGNHGTAIMPRTPEHARDSFPRAFRQVYPIEVT